MAKKEDLAKFVKSIKGHDFSGELADDDFCEKVRLFEHTNFALKEIGLEPDEDDLSEYHQAMTTEFICWLAKSYLSRQEKNELITRISPRGRKKGGKRTK